MLEPRLEVAFWVAASVEPADSDWIDLSDRLRDFDGGPGGRERILDRIEAGAMTFVLDNSDRALDPTNIASPYYPDVAPMVHVRFSEKDSGRPLFRGHANGWRMRFPSHGKDQITVLTATDAQKVLANASLPGSVWEREIKALVDAGTVQAWLRLGDPPGTKRPLDSGPNGFSSVTKGSPQFGDRSLLQSKDTGVSFPATGDLVKLSESASIVTANWTMECLIQRSPEDVVPMNTTSEILIALWDGDSTNAYASSSYIDMGFPSAATFGRFRAEVSLAGSVTTVTSTKTVWDDKVHHLVARRVWNGVTGTLDIFIDGVKVATTALNSGSAPADMHQITVGNFFEDPENGFSGDQNFRGTMQELVLYGSALSDQDIATHARWALRPFDGVYTSQAVSDALDDIAWPASRRRFSGGVSVLQNHELGGTALSYIQRVTETEAGIFGFDEAGDAVFYGREYVQSQDRITHVLTFANDPDDELGWIPYEDIEFAHDDTRLVNEVRASREGGTVQVVRNSDSVDTYLIHSRDLSGLLHDNDSEVKEHARFVVDKLKDFRTEVRSITVNLRDPRVDVDALFGAFEGNSPGLLQVRVVHKLLGEDDPIDGTYRVEQVEHRGNVRRHDWTVDLRLSPWSVERDVPWILGHPVHGRLGVTTRLGF